MSTEVCILNRLIGRGHPCFIAAEVGINHNGDISLAHRCIDAAAECGADAVKFQNYRTEDFVVDRSLAYSYLSQGVMVTEPQFDLFKRCELKNGQLAELKAHCDEVGLTFFSTPTGLSGIHELVSMGCALIKNGSDLLTNLDLVRALAETRIPTVLSTGMATVAEIDDAVRAFRMAGGRDPILLHCTSSYPTPQEDVNLRRIPVLSEVFGCPAGFSDHSEGMAAAIGAVALGACFVEKHFTLDRNLPGPDHRFSSDPVEFQALVRGIRQVEAGLGTAKLGPTPSEDQGRLEFRLSCSAVVDLRSGTRISSENVAFLRPGRGIPPNQVAGLIGLRLRRDVLAGHVFTWEDFRD